MRNARNPFPFEALDVILVLIFLVLLLLIVRELKKITRSHQQIAAAKGSAPPPGAPRSRAAQKSLYSHIKIKGSREFIEATKEALALASTTSFAYLLAYILTIEEAGSRGNSVGGGMYVLTKQCLIVWSIIKQVSREFYAGVILHEGCHSAMFWQAKERRRGAIPPQHEYGGTAAERICYGVARKGMEELNAPQAEIDQMAKNEKSYVEDGTQEW